MGIRVGEFRVKVPGSSRVIRVSGLESGGSRL